MPQTQSNSNKAKIAKIQKILEHFLQEVNAIRHERDEKIQALYKQVEEKKIHEILDELKNNKV